MSTVDAVGGEGGARQEGSYKILPGARPSEMTLR
jgi:hypothetical protein